MSDGRWNNVVCLLGCVTSVCVTNSIQDSRFSSQSPLIICLLSLYEMNKCIAKTIILWNHRTGAFKKYVRSNLPIFDPPPLVPSCSFLDNPPPPSSTYTKLFYQREQNWPYNFLKSERTPPCSFLVDPSPPPSGRTYFLNAPYVVCVKKINDLISCLSNEKCPAWPIIIGGLFLYSYVLMFMLNVLNSFMLIVFSILWEGLKSPILGSVYLKYFTFFWNEDKLMIC